MGVMIEAKEINMSKSIELFNDKNLKIGELRSGTYSPHFEKVIELQCWKNLIGKFPKHLKYQ